MRHFLIATLGGICLAACGHTAKPSEEGLVGLWVWAADEEPSQRDVSIQKTGNGWKGRVNGVEASVRETAGVITLEAEGGDRFEGRLSPNGATLKGRWQQPTSSLGYSTMVTLADLPRTGDARWATTIDVQPRPFRVFLDVFEGEGEDLFAVIRNPERNEVMRATRFAVEATDENTWELVAGQGERQVRQSLVQTENGLQLDHFWFDTPRELRRAAPVETVGYFPNPESRAPMSYSVPPTLDDGWRVASPEEVGFDRAKLDALVARISTMDPRDTRPNLIHSVLVAHKGQLVMEEYFYGYDRNTVHDTRSLGKVFAPVLIGALQQSGIAIDADVRPIGDVLKDAGETIDDPRKSEITLAHLMSFTSGLDCDGNRYESPGSEDRMWDQGDEQDFWRYTARLPVLHDPGTRYAYCSGSINLAGAAIRAAAGKPIVELFDELIAQPLEFGAYHWNLAPNGAAYLGGGVYLKPRDILKIGAVHAAGGKWDGKQIIDADWVTESTTAFMDITPETTGMTEEAFNNSYFGGSAAYEWRVDTVRTGERTYRSYEASGNGGQVLVVVPELDLTVLFMGGNYRQGGIWGRWRNSVVGGHIIPAMQP